MTLTFGDVERLLTDGGALGNADLVLVGLTEEQVSLLAAELSPANDYPTRWVASTPALGFTHGGFTVRGSRAESLPRHREIREKLRPALVAANHFRRRIAWHVDLLASGSNWSRSHASEQYVAAFLQSLKAQGEPNRLYEELEENGDALFPLFDDILRIEPIRTLLDARAVPFLLRYANAGTDELFESLCWMASQVDSPAVDPVLGALFSRWVHRFDPNTQRRQRGQSYAFWRSFSALRRHPRFRLIPGYDLRLAELLRLNIVWFHKQDLVEAINGSPRTYIHHETMLFRATPFEHWRRDDVDRLDEAADALFVATQNDDDGLA